MRSLTLQQHGKDVAHGKAADQARLAGKARRPPPHEYARACVGAERDPAFLANLERVAPKGKKVILMCGMGGSLDTVVRVETTGKQCNDPERHFGR